MYWAAGGWWLTEVSVDLTSAEWELFVLKIVRNDTRSAAFVRNWIGFGIDGGLEETPAEVEVKLLG